MALPPGLLKAILAKKGGKAKDKKKGKPGEKAVKVMGKCTCKDKGNCTCKNKMAGGGKAKGKMPWAY